MKTLRDLSLLIFAHTGIGKIKKITGICDKIQISQTGNIQFFGTTCFSVVPKTQLFVTVFSHLSKHRCHGIPLALGLRA